MKRAAGIFLAAFAVLVPSGFDGGQAVAQTGDLSEAEALQKLEAKAVQIIIGKTAAEIRRALEAGPFSDVQVMEFNFVSPPEQAAQQGYGNIKPGDLHVIFARPKKSVFRAVLTAHSVFRRHAGWCCRVDRTGEDLPQVSATGCVVF